MESTFKDEIRVGLFVTGGLALLLTSILMLGGDRLLFKSTYNLHVKMEQVQGLTQGSVVSLSGVDVGHIKEITFTPDSKLELVLDIDRDFAVRITDGSRASVRTQGALGDKYIYIEPGPTDTHSLKDGDYLLADESGDIIDMIKEKGPELGHLVDAIKEVHFLIRSLNEGNRGAKLMANLVNSSENLNHLLVESRLAVKDLRGGERDNKNLREAMVHLASILEKVDKGQGTLGAIINDPSVHERLMSLLGESPRNKYLKPLIRDTIQSQDKSP
ncbi:MAG: MCE family protein [Bdellovibrionaceae bacterium]|nr:MCE family protein [Bdellovibrionales bacterium]MCB9086457.1 MCE family protein [Pseudobdellovibrionaceae bacterium]